MIPVSACEMHLQKFGGGGTGQVSLQHIKVSHLKASSLCGCSGS